MQATKTPRRYCQHHGPRRLAVLPLSQRLAVLPLSRRLAVLCFSLAARVRWWHAAFECGAVLTNSEHHLILLSLLELDVVDDRESEGALLQSV